MVARRGFFGLLCHRLCVRLGFHLRYGAPAPRLPSSSTTTAPTNPHARPTRVRVASPARLRAPCQSIRVGVGGAYFVTRSRGVSTTPDTCDCFLCSLRAFSAVSIPNTACFAAYWSAVASTRPSFSIGLIALMLS